MRYIVIVVSVVILIGGFACREKGIEPHPSAIYLTAEDVGVTDAWLRLTVMSTTENDSIALVRDGQLLFNARLKIQNAKLDTLIFDENLLPNHGYTYQAFRYWGELQVDRTADLKITTMDTTSHNFTWEIDTLGDGNSSVLHDVAILSDTLAYAVGEIYKRDSLGQWNTDPYNFLKWGGKKWEMQSITYVPVRAVFAFSENDIWVGTSAPYHWDGNSWRAYNVTGIFNGYINKIWGTSSSDLYIVGTNGSIAFFNGSRWVKLNSGTTVSINDIWGAVDENTGKRLILCAASNIYDPGERKILTITEQNTVDTIPWVYRRRINSIWFKNEKRLFTAGDGVFVREPDNIWKEFVELGPYFTDHVRGIATNDIFVVGDFGQVWHWNGVSWRQYTEVSAVDVFYSLSYKNNKMSAVGFLGSRAILLHMQRK